jgi:hypothetical protein
MDNPEHSEKKGIKRLLAQHWSLFAATAVFCLATASLFVRCRKGDRGHFVYPLDDIYISMAVAKSFAFHGVWGVTPYEFASCESTTIWPVLLAAIFRLVGPSELAPLVLATLFALLSIWLSYGFLKSFRLGQVDIFSVLVAFIFFTPLPTLVLSGMEHTLQIATAIAFFWLAADELSDEKPRTSRRPSRWLWVLAPLLTLTRFEGLFLAFAVCSLFLVRKRWRLASGLGGLALAPVVIVGGLSAWKGWFWLPSSIYLKANLPRVVRSAQNIVPYIHGAFAWSAVNSRGVLGFGFVFLLLFWLLVRKDHKLWRKSTVLIVLWLIAAVLHLKFAGFGWLLRYEAYLLALGLLILSVGAYECVLRSREGRWGNVDRAGAVLLLIFLAVGVFPVLASRGVSAALLTSNASKTIFEQHYQMGQFVRQFYRGQSVAVNDIGAVSYFGEPRLIDLWGLASIDVAKERVRGNLSQSQIAHLTLARNTKIAIVYANSFKNGFCSTDGLPSQWKAVGTWTDSDTASYSETTLTFFAVDPTEELRLTNALRHFAPQLPPSVLQAGPYTLASDSIQPSPQSP